MDRWATLKLNNRGTNAVLSGATVRVQDGRDLYLIGPESERWEGVNLDSGRVLIPRGSD
jgi:hypothetical protein